ncbi:TadE family protein [Streptomyces boninensis]|uniref:TadE family protein n=1 Tax=Streptomyces boninensis TaxID=2039455 RepID=UPI003B20E688
MTTDSRRGSATVEFILLTPILLALMLFVVYCGRAADTRLRIEDAAHQAARAATLARTPTAAAADARSAATAALDEAGVACRSLRVDAGTGQLQPGSTISVTVICTIDQSDLALLNVPGHATLDARSHAVVDEFRGTVTTTARR